MMWVWLANLSPRLWDRRCFPCQSIFIRFLVVTWLILQAFSGEDIPTAQSRWEMQAHQKWHGIFSAVWFTSKFELKVQKCYFEKLSSSQFLCALICQGYIWRARKIRYIYVDIWTFSDKILWKNNFSTLFNLIGWWCYLSHFHFTQIFASIAWSLCRGVTTDRNGLKLILLPGVQFF